MSDALRRNSSVVNIAQKLARIDEHWSPRIVGALNGQHVKLAKLLGEFDWHRHADEDELFLVIEGRLEMRFRDRSEFIGRGEFLIVPCGVEHCPVAEVETHILLFEPESTRNTGDVRTDRTIDEPEWL